MIFALGQQPARWVLKKYRINLTEICRKNNISPRVLGHVLDGYIPPPPNVIKAFCDAAYCRPHLLFTEEALKAAATHADEMEAITRECASKPREVFIREQRAEIARRRAERVEAPTPIKLNKGRLDRLTWGKVGGVDFTKWQRVAEEFGLDISTHEGRLAAATLVTGLQASYSRDPRWLAVAEEFQRPLKEQYAARTPTPDVVARLEAVEERRRELQATHNKMRTASASGEHRGRKATPRPVPLPGELI